MSKRISSIALAGLILVSFFAVAGCASGMSSNGGSFSFEPRVNYEIGNYPLSGCAADFDGDGNPDIAVTNKYYYSSGPSTVSILLNNGDGTFKSQVEYALGFPKGGGGISPADFDGDGDIDIVTHVGQYKIGIFYNNGDGTFGTYNEYSTGIDSATLIIADFNGDGNIDVATDGGFIGAMSVLLNDGDGTFGSYTIYSHGISSYRTFGIEGADIDGDGDIDIAVQTYDWWEVWYGSGYSDIFVVVFKNGGNGLFSLDATYLNGHHSGAGPLVASDFDNDGDIDIATRNDGPAHDYFSVLFNDGNGTFDSRTEYSVQDHNWGILAADFDRDGDMDIATGNMFQYPPEYGWPGYVAIYPNDGDGNFGEPHTFDTSNGTGPMFMSDFDGDLAVDIGSVNLGTIADLTNPEGRGTVSILINELEVSPEDLVEAINDYIQNLPDDAFRKNPEQRKNALSNKLEEVIALIDAGEYKKAIEKLQNDIRLKMDGDPAPVDWIIDADAQAGLLEMIDELIEYLERMFV